MRRTEVSPAFLGSLALHGLAIAALLISWRFTHEIRIGSAVPVTIVSNAPSTDLREAEQAPEPQTAQTEAPAPEAPPQASPPPAQPAPTPPAPKPAPAKPQPAPTPAKSQTPTKPEKSLDLDALAASLSKSTKSQTPKPSSAAKGPNRAETAQQARPAAGTGLSAAALNGLVEELQRRWNPNCDVQGGRDVIVKVTFQLDAGGGVVGQVGSQIARGQGGVAQVAATRAVSAVYAASPFRNLPRDLYGQRISVNFIAKDACS